MGITFTRVVVANPERVEDPGRDLELLVDAGAIYSVVPEDVLDALGIARLERQQFTLADGTHVAYDIGEARFTVGGKTRTSQGVFAPPGVTPLLGVLALESLGLMVNPVTRELLPMRLLLARAS